MKLEKLKQVLKPSSFKIGLVLTVLSLVIYAMGFPFLNTMELKAFDLHFLSRGKTQPGGEVAIVTIDEKSIDRIGRWPWPRTKIAELIDKLGAYGARVVALDIIFSEPDHSSGSTMLQGLQSKVSDPEAKAVLATAAAEADNDARLASSLKRNPNVTLGYFFFMTKEEIRHRKQEPGPDAGYDIPSRFTSIRLLEKDAPQ